MLVHPAPIGPHVECGRLMEATRGAVAKTFRPHDRRKLRHRTDAGHIDRAPVSLRRTVPEL